VTTLFSFVGTNNYLDANYTFEDRSLTRPERFTQAAIVQLLAQRPERICLALTVKARSTNWPMLEARLHELGYRSTDIKTINIPDGNSEVELWDIFGKLVDIAEGPVVFDATHGFRALPLVATLALPFHGEHSGFRIDRLVYGMFDQFRPHEPAPIVDLSAMLDLPIWHQAVNDFKFHGRARRLEERLSRPVKDLQAQLRHHAPPDLVNLPRLLARLSDHLSVNKVNAVPALATEVVQCLREAANQVERHQQSRVLKPLISVVRELTTVLQPLVQKEDEELVEVYLRLASWYAEREQYGSAYTTLREAVTDQIVNLSVTLGVSYVQASAASRQDDSEEEPPSTSSDSGRKEPSTSTYRMAVDRVFLLLARGENPGQGEDRRMVASLRHVIEEYPALQDSEKALKSMGEQRNKINHAFKGESDREKLTRDSRTGRLTLHSSFINNLESVRGYLSRLAAVVRTLTS